MADHARSAATRASLGVEARGKRVLFRQNRAMALQIIGGDPTFIHPFAKAFIANELGDPHGLINGCVLLWRASYLVLVGQHEPLASSSLFCAKSTNSRSLDALVGS